MKKIFLTVVVLLCFCCCIYSQISTEEYPISFGRDIPALTINRNTQKVNIYRTDLNSGIYYVKMTMNEKIVVKKVLIQ